jgi:UDP-N-acetylmuramate dehydrogenase
MNAGAWGGETWALVRRVEVVDRAGNRRVRGPGDYRIGYRSVRGPADEWFLAAELALRPGSGTQAAARIRELLRRRGETQPTGQASCGSVFRNPEGDHAGRLIEACGLKGLRIGGAEVSPKHANFIVNTGGARAADIEALMARVRTAVAERFGVRLESEVRIVGEAEEVDHD